MGHSEAVDIRQRLIALARDIYKTLVECSDEGENGIRVLLRERTTSVCRLLFLGPRQLIEAVVVLLVVVLAEEVFQIIGLTAFESAPGSGVSSAVPVISVSEGRSSASPDAVPVGTGDVGGTGLEDEVGAGVAAGDVGGTGAEDEVGALEVEGFSPSKSSSVLLPVPVRGASSSELLPSSGSNSGLGRFPVSREDATGPSKCQLSSAC